MSITAFWHEITTIFSPMTWLLVLGIIVLLGLHLAAYIHGYQLLAYRSYIAIVLSLLLGASAFWWLPLMANSHLAYINGLWGWVSLSVSALVIALVGFLYFHPFCFLVREAGK
ncbi:hypothetical protein R5M92_08175 [Halomonas sp. Bachu 37]|uniref:hypothetical protein n=1 Tax=Halomonas kashgarensis TaxID=3084920 RepID=UPI00321688DC